MRNWPESGTSVYPTRSRFFVAGNEMISDFFSHAGIFNRPADGAGCNPADQWLNSTWRVSWLGERQQAASPNKRTSGPVPVATTSELIGMEIQNTEVANVLRQTASIMGRKHWGDALGF